MLLRSSSAPILNSWLSHSKDSSPPESESILHLSRTRSVSLTSNSLHSPTRDPANNSSPQVILESHVPTQPKSKNKYSIIPFGLGKKSAKKAANQQQELKPMSGSSPGTGRFFSSSGMGEKLVDDEDSGVGKKEGVLETLVAGGGAGSSGGKICGGGGSGKGSNGGGGGRSGGVFESNNQGSGSTDAYYQKMIQADPGNALLLGNYAKFLKEVRGDYAKAEEYFGRAILANPSDANTLSLYGDLIWNTQKDAERAETYFDQAVKTSPDDCYVLASYAHFLWDAEEGEDDDNEESEGVEREAERSHASSSNFFHGSPHHSPLTAAS